MAQKIMLIDDLDESEAAETIRYTVEGQEYEIDLSEQNAADFRAGLARYIERSRIIEAPSPAVTRRRATRRTGAAAASRTGDSESSQIREWAKGRGIEVNPRGRIKTEVREQYYAEAAQGQRTQATGNNKQSAPQTPDEQAEQPA